MTPEEVRDMKMRAKAGKAYDRALTNTAPAPAPAPAPKATPKQKMTPAEEEMVQEKKDEKMREKIKAMGYKAGGFVKAADGIAQRGKTRGKIC